MEFPQIISLNGTSSSGKTAIAKALQELLPRIYLNFSVDSILYALPDSALVRMTTGKDISDLNYPRLDRSFNACVRRLAEMGNLLVIDNAMVRVEQVTDFLHNVSGLSVLLVGVHCSMEVLSRRERQRQDRTIGEAAGQFDRIHRHVVYDVEVDSTIKTPHDLALEIVGHLHGHRERYGVRETLERIRRLTGRE